MTNKYPGTCCKCAGAVDIGAGIAEPGNVGWTVRHTVCPESPALAPSGAFYLPNRYDALEGLVNAMREPWQLNEVRQILRGFLDRNEKHPLRDAEYGFARCYKLLNKRAEQLGFMQKNSDKMFFRPLPKVAVNPI